MLYKILTHNIDGKVYWAIKNIPQLCTHQYKNVPGSYTHTDWFDCTSGLKQGCTLSQTLWTVIANDLIRETNDLDLGVSMGEVKVPCSCKQMISFLYCTQKDIYSLCWMFCTVGVKGGKFL